MLYILFVIPPLILIGSCFLWAKVVTQKHEETIKELQKEINLERGRLSVMMLTIEDLMKKYDPKVNVPESCDMQYLDVVRKYLGPEERRNLLSSFEQYKKEKAK